MGSANGSRVYFLAILFFLQAYYSFSESIKTLDPESSTEISVLIEIYRTVKDPFKRLVSWENSKIHNGTACKCFGIKCNSQNKIISINLSSLELSGLISPSLGKLSDLKLINFRNNHFVGSIPPELGNLKNLTHLNLHNNSLNGEIPKDLSNLHNLKLLDLSKNSLDGHLPEEFRSLKKLKVLDLSFNNLTGIMPLTLSSVQYLNIFGTKLKRRQIDAPLISSDDPSDDDDQSPCETAASILRFNTSARSWENPCSNLTRKEGLEENEGELAWNNKTGFRYLGPLISGFAVFLVVFVVLAIFLTNRFKVGKRDLKSPVGFLTLDIPQKAGSPRTPKEVRGIILSMGKFSPRVVKEWSRQNSIKEDPNEEVFSYGIQPFSGTAMLASSYKPKSNLNPNHASRLGSPAFPPTDLTIKIPPSYIP